MVMKVSGDPVALIFLDFNLFLGQRPNFFLGPDTLGYIPDGPNDFLAAP